MVAMFDGRIVIAAQHDESSEPQFNGSLAFTYTRTGSSVMPRGVAVEGFASTSMSLANQRLLLGMRCSSTFTGCSGSGKVNLYNLNVFE